MLNLLVLLLSSQLLSAAGQSEAVSGDWLGAIRMPNETVTIFLHVKEVGAELQARLEIPNVRDIEFDRVAFDEPRLSLVRSHEPALEVEARLEDAALGGNCALGGGLEGPFQLVRIGASGDPAYERAWNRGFIGPDGSVFLAHTHAARREDAAAFLWLRRAQEGGAGALQLFSDPEFDRLRADPRWREICRDSTTDHPELSALTYRIRRTRERMSMRDGVELVADLLLPEADDKLPTILVRTPYSRGSEVAAYAHFVARGYALLVQSVRGRAESGGTFVPWTSERKDGFDTIEWIAKQPWSNGKVGMIGASYLGQVQWAAAAEAPPALRCILPIVSGTDHFFDVPYDHGLLKLGLAFWAFSMDERVPRPLPDDIADALLTTLPLARLDEALFGQSVAIWDRWLECDSPGAWKGANFLADASHIRVPVLHVSGWWDGELGATQRNYAAQRAAGHEDQWLVLGPWPHNVNRSTRYADLDYGPNAPYDLTSLYVRWFDTWLKGKPVGLAALPRVQVFVTGADEWRGLESWPDARASELALYMDSATPLHGLSQRGRLASQCSQQGEPDQFTYDPAQVHPQGRVDLERSTCVPLDPDDVDALVYESVPLEATLEIAGAGELQLFVSTSAQDTDFFALLLDVDESGVARALTQPGKLRLRYRSGYDEPAFLEPGAVLAVAIELLPCAHRFERGHRIAVLVCSEWFPAFERNTNTGERAGEAVRLVVAQQRVYHDAARPSTLRLLLLPAQSTTPKKD